MTESSIDILTIIVKSGKRIHDKFQYMEKDGCVVDKLWFEHGKVHEHVTYCCQSIAGVYHLELRVVNHEKRLSYINIIFSSSLQFTKEARINNK